MGGKNESDPAKLGAAVANRDTVPVKPLIPSTLTVVSTPQKPGWIVMLEAVTFVEKSGVKPKTLVGPKKENVELNTRTVTSVDNSLLIRVFRAKSRFATDRA